LFASFCCWKNNSGRKEEEFDVEDGVSDEEDEEAEGGAGTGVFDFIIHLNTFISEEVRL
jgi:hypothetical protein